MKIGFGWDVYLGRVYLIPVVNSCRAPCTDKNSPEEKLDGGSLTIVPGCRRRRGLLK